MLACLSACLQDCFCILISAWFIHIILVDVCLQLFRLFLTCILVFIQREYEEFKVRINTVVANSHKVPEGGWSLPEGAPWHGNNVRDHAGMVQVGCFICL
jgi:hypothetical protein